ncbi:hypothetical protein OF83DRAFT_1178335 [Amylostereum chailletii]|nr:hypothetical protein OF83DRAFT_1178335 [Amylostereum chailletii]
MLTRTFATLGILTIDHRGLVRSSPSKPPSQTPTPTVALHIRNTSSEEPTSTLSTLPSRLPNLPSKRIHVLVRRVRRPPADRGDVPKVAHLNGHFANATERSYVPLRKLRLRDRRASPRTGA